MQNLIDLTDIVIHDVLNTGDMVQVKPYLDTTENGVPFEGEHSGKVGVIAAFSARGAERDCANKAVVQIRHDNGLLETFAYDINGLALLERRATDRDR